jgi:hypothetical protein
VVSQHKVVSPQKVARDTAEVGLTRLMRTLAVILPSLALLQTVANARDYRQPAVAIVVWLAVLGAGLWLVPRLRSGGLAAGETAAAIAVAVAAVAAIGAAHRTHITPGSVDLAILGTVWLLLLIVVSHSARVWVPVSLLVFAMQGALLIREQGLNLLSLSQVGGAGYIIATALIAFATLLPTLDVHASMAARQASLASRSAAEQAAAAAIRQERGSRLAVLEREALPLLRAVADGTLDPADRDVAEQCARHAAVLRQILTDGASGGELVARLEQALKDAAGRGLPVTIQLIGDLGTPAPSVARAVQATVDAVLRALPPHQAVLTVLAAGGDVELYLIFSAPMRAAPDLTRFALDVPAAARWHAELSATETGGGTDGGFLEVSWRKDGAV